LAVDLDKLGLYHAAAYASMAADAVAESLRDPVRDNDLSTDIEVEFEVDEHGRVWMIREGDCHIIGRTNAVCAEMRRFLTTVLLGRHLPSIGVPAP
jgi:hypothetical protein